MKYIPSINIESGIHQEFQYIVTPNAKEVLGNIVESFHSGIHSFTIIGNYGTGKSSFIVGLEKDLENGTSNLVTNRNVFGDVTAFEFMNIVGDYASLSDVLSAKLDIANFADSKNIFEALSNKYKECKKNGKFLFIVIDEFGKILEYAANNNPEKELYFLQKLAEFVNHPLRNVILLTTLHQNFGSYAYKLNDAQRNEWLKIKGRYKEIVFVEPVEQLMFLASEQLNGNLATMKENAKTNFIQLFTNKQAYITSFYRLIVLPLIIVFAFQFLPETLHEVRTVLLIASSAPVAVLVPIFASMFQKDVIYGSHIVCLSTLLCLFTMPLIIMLSEIIWF